MTETKTLPAAYLGRASVKSETLAQLAEHRRLDEIVQRTYWSDGKGCAVGCLTHNPSGGHDQFPERWGIPVQIAYLMDDIFESLNEEESKDWPLRIMAAIPAGADLSRTWDRWCAWMLNDLIPISGVNAPVVEVMAHLFERAGGGDEPTTAEWDNAAWEAWAARAAWAAWAAREARAARAARAAWEAWEAWEAWAARAAWESWARRAADALVDIVEHAPVPGAMASAG